jgi:hypothetical protein
MAGGLGPKNANHSITGFAQLGQSTGEVQPRLMARRYSKSHRVSQSQCNLLLDNLRA